MLHRVRYLIHQMDQIEGWVEGYPEEMEKWQAKNKARLIQRSEELKTQIESIIPGLDLTSARSTRDSFLESLDTKENATQLAAFKSRDTADHAHSPNPRTLHMCQCQTGTYEAGFCESLLSLGWKVSRTESYAAGAGRDGSWHRFVHEHITVTSPRGKVYHF